MNRPALKKILALVVSTVKLILSFLTVQLVVALICLTIIQLFSLETEHLGFYINVNRLLPHNPENLIFLMHVADIFTILLYFLASYFLRMVDQRPNQIKLSLYLSWFVFFSMHQIMMILVLDIIALFKLDLISVYSIPNIFLLITLRIALLVLFVFIVMQKREQWKLIFSIQNRKWKAEKEDSLKSHLLVSWGAFFFLLFGVMLYMQRIEWVLYFLFLSFIFIPVLAFITESSAESSD